MPSSSWRVRRGMQAYGLDGRRVGEVVDVLDVGRPRPGTDAQSAERTFRVARGGPAAGYLLVPYSGIADVRGERVYLSVRKGDVDTTEWITRVGTSALTTPGEPSFRV